MNSDFELLPHTADLQIKVYGKSIQELFEHAVIGMFQSIKPKTNQSHCNYRNERLVCKELPIERQVRIQASDLDLLLVDFLSELLTLSDIYNEAYLKAQVIFIDPLSLVAKVRGILIQGFEVVEIKAVTYAGVSIQQRDGIWSTALIFDI